VLLLHGKAAPVAKPSAFEPCPLLNLEMHPFERIFEFRASGALPSSEKETNEIFAAYLDQVERVSRMSIK